MTIIRDILGQTLKNTFLKGFQKDNIYIYIYNYTYSILIEDREHQQRVLKWNFFKKSNNGKTSRVQAIATTHSKGNQLDRNKNFNFIPT